MRVHIDDGYGGPVCGEVVMDGDRVEEYREAVQFFGTCCPPCVELHHELAQHASEDDGRYPHSDEDAFMEATS